MKADQRFNKSKAPQVEDVVASTSLTRSLCPEDQRVNVYLIDYGTELKENEMPSTLRIRMSQSEALSLGRSLVQFGETELTQNGGKRDEDT